MRVQQGQNVLLLADGATLVMPADAIGLATTATLTVTYRGTNSQGAIINTMDFSGLVDFSVSGLPDVPFTLLPNQSFTVTLTYKPSNSQRNSAKVAFNYNDGRIFAPLTLNLQGTAPEFAFSYVPQGGNATLLSPSGTITFPQTPVNTTVTAAVVLTNRGSGAGAVNAISATAPQEFQLVGLPLPQTSVDAGKDLRFGVSFTPKQLQTVRGSLAIDFADKQVTFNVEGSGSGPQFAYETAQDNTFSAILPNQLVTLPDAVVGDKSTIVVRVRNTGNADAKIAAISVAGAGFTLTDLPFLPATLTPGNAATVTITFTPTQPGRVTGRLRIGDDSFDIAGNGLGATLQYSYTVASVSTTVAANGSVIFTPVAVGGTSSVRFLINNNGTASTSIGSISVVGTGTVFTLADLPALPVTLQPGQVVPFTVNFLPTVQGNATATLKLDTVSFTLSGTANPPAALPDYKIEGASGNIEPQTQFPVTLTLNQAYPLALKGTLTLGFNSEAFGNDPAVQFATGGRTATFLIPANTTREMFNNTTQTQVRLQTGTVAGNITLTPSFQTNDGGIDLTPTNPPGMIVSVAQSAPRLLSVQLSQKTASGITILVTGYATGRSITQMDFQFTPTPEENVPTTKLTMAVEPSFTAWYGGAQSQQFGSLFTATIPFTFTGELKKVTNLSDTVQAVSVTLTNRQGSSAARSLDLH